MLNKPQQQPHSQVNSDAAKRIKVCDGGRELEAVWEPGSPPSTYHSAWLRHNCQCSQCLTSSGQKTMAPADLDPTAAITEARITESGDVEMRWSCGHEGRLSTDWLRRHCYSSHSLHKAMKSRCLNTATQSSLPTMGAGELEEEHGVWRWLTYLNECGVCLLRGAPVTDGSIERITRKISHIQKTVYGEVSDILAVENPINVAYTTLGLEPHMDLEYYESPPGLHLLLCVRNDVCVSGGESVVDGLAVLERLRHTSPPSPEFPQPSRKSTMTGLILSTWCTRDHTYC